MFLIFFVKLSVICRHNTGLSLELGLSLCLCVNDSKVGVKWLHKQQENIPLKMFRCKNWTEN